MQQFALGPTLAHFNFRASDEETGREMISDISKLIVTGGKWVSLCLIPFPGKWLPNVSQFFCVCSTELLDFELLSMYINMGGGRADKQFKGNHFSG